MKANQTLIIILSATTIIICASFLAGQTINGTLTESQLALSLFLGAVTFFLSTSINGVKTSTPVFLSMLALTFGSAAVTALAAKVLTPAILRVASCFENDMMVCVFVALFGVLLGIFGLAVILSAAQKIGDLELLFQNQEVEGISINERTTKPAVCLIKK